MSFLDMLGSEDERDDFLGISSVVDLREGHYLLRRGEAGGDMFEVMAGELEVVDTRSSPEVIIASIGPGAVVGDMGFLDGSPRSADVRASLDSRIRRWTRGDILDLIDENPRFGSRFYHMIARLATDRLRNMTDIASAVSRSSGTPQQGPAPETQEARSLAEDAKRSLVDIETTLRAGTEATNASADLQRVLETLQRAVNHFFSVHEPSETIAAEEVFQAELQPFLLRSTLALRSIKRPQGRSATSAILSYVQVGAVEGEGKLGRMIDQWLLERPSIRALYSMNHELIEAYKRYRPDHVPTRILQLCGGSGSLASGLAFASGDRRTQLTVVDQTRDSLSFLETNALVGLKSVEVRTVQENLAQLAIGRARIELGKHDIIVVQGLVEYMPDRIVLALLRTLREHLVDDGTILLGSLGPSEDTEFMNRLLRWPTIRRTPENLERMLSHADLRAVWSSTDSDPGLVFAIRALNGPGRTLPSEVGQGTVPAVAPDAASE